MILPATTPASAVSISTEEARALTDRIRTAVDSVWALLVEAHETRAWAALGYDTWAAYVEQEFSMTRQRSYQLLDQGRISRALQEAAGVHSCPDATNMFDTTARSGQALKPVLEEVTAEIRERVESGEAPEEAIRAAVEVHTRPKLSPAPPRFQAEEDPDDDAPDLLGALEEAEREMNRLRALVESLQKTDTDREIASWSAKYAALNGRLQQSITTGNEAKKQAEYQGKLLKKIRDTLGVDKNANIMEAIYDLKR